MPVSKIERASLGFSGAVLQVVSVNNKQQTSTTGGDLIASSLAASITPTSSTSKISYIAACQAVKNKYPKS